MHPIISRSQGIHHWFTTKDVQFRLPPQNMLILKGQTGDIVVAGLVPNAGKALAAQGLRPDIAIVHTLVGLNEIFFPCAISSAQQGKPVIVVVPDQKMKEAVEQYMLIAYRPFAKASDPYAPFELDASQIRMSGIPEQQQDELIAEIEYYDPRCERDLGKLINVVVAEEGQPQSVNLKGSTVTITHFGKGIYTFNNQQIDANQFTAVQFATESVPNLSAWQPRFGIFMLGVNSGGAPQGFSTALLQRSCAIGASVSSVFNRVIDCGPQIPTLLRESGFSDRGISTIDWVITHTHPDHDAGLFELLRDPAVSSVRIYTHPFAAEAIFRKAQILGLEAEAIAKIPYLQGACFEPDKFDKNPVYNLAPHRMLHIGGMQTEWTLHGIPTVMFYRHYKTPSLGVRASLVYAADGAFSEDRLSEIRSAGALSPQREERIRAFVNQHNGYTALVEEVGMGGEPQHPANGIKFYS